MAKPDRSAPRRTAGAPSRQGQPGGPQQEQTAAHGADVQPDRAPSGRIRARRSARRAAPAPTAAATGTTVSAQAGTAPSDTAQPAPATGAAANPAGRAPQRKEPPRRALRRPSWVEPTTGPGAPLTAKQDRERATLAHFSVALGFVAPLAVWLLYRDRGPFTAQEAKEALNFAVPPTLLMGALFFLGQLPVLGPVCAVLGALTWMVMAVYGVLGGAQVNKGRPYRYPFNLRLLR